MRQKCTNDTCSANRLAASTTLSGLIMRSVRAKNSRHWSHITGTNNWNVNHGTFFQEQVLILIQEHVLYVLQ